MTVPLTCDGERRLTAELTRAEQVIDPPALVWVFDADRLREQRATLHGWRPGAPPRALILWHEHEAGPVDRVAWVCDVYVRPRHE